jgi:hypothetical protein
MVDKILDQPIEQIMIRELLRLSPDLLEEIWGISCFPPVNKATIPTTQATGMGVNAMAATAAKKNDFG